MQDLRRIF